MLTDITKMADDYFEKNPGEKDYISTSSIDRAPKEPKYNEDEDGQMSFVEKGPADEEEKPDESDHRAFKTELVLKLRPTDTNAGNTITLLKSELHGHNVVEQIYLALAQERNREIIASILDNPTPDAQPAEKKYPVTIDGQVYQSTRPSMTGKQLLALLGKNYDQCDLIQMRSDGSQIKITLNKVVSLEMYGVTGYRTEDVLQKADSGSDVANSGEIPTESVAQPASDEDFKNNENF